MYRYDIVHVYIIAGPGHWTQYVDEPVKWQYQSYFSMSMENARKLVFWARNWAVVKVHINSLPMVMSRGNTSQITSIFRPYYQYFVVNTEKWISGWKALPWPTVIIVTWAIRPRCVKWSGLETRDWFSFQLSISRFPFPILDALEHVNHGL